MGIGIPSNTFTAKAVAKKVYELIKTLSFGFKLQATNAVINPAVPFITPNEYFELTSCFKISSNSSTFDFFASPYLKILSFSNTFIIASFSLSSNNNPPYSFGFI